MNPEPNPFGERVETSAEKQQRLLQEMHAQNRQFPSLGRLTIGVALYGLHVLASSIFTALRTGHWLGLSGGVLVLLWTFRMGMGLRQRQKWVWWLTTLASVLLTLRFVIGLLAQVALKRGLSHPTATLHYDPVKVLFYLTGLAIVGFVVFNALQKTTREFIFSTPIASAD